MGFPLFYMAEFMLMCNCRLIIISSELSGGPPSTWMGVALASDDYSD